MRLSLLFGAGEFPLRFFGGFFEKEIHERQLFVFETTMDWQLAMPIKHAIMLNRRNSSPRGVSQLSYVATDSTTLSKDDRS